MVRFVTWPSGTANGTVMTAPRSVVIDVGATSATYVGGVRISIWSEAVVETTPPLTVFRSGSRYTNSPRAFVYAYGEAGAGDPSLGQMVTFSAAIGVIVATHRATIAVSPGGSLSVRVGHSACWIRKSDRAGVGGCATSGRGSSIDIGSKSAYSPPGDSTVSAIVPA